MSASDPWKAYPASQVGGAMKAPRLLPQALPGHTHARTHPHLLVLIGRHSYELGFREGAVGDHAVGAPHAHYVNLGLVFVQGVQHYLLRGEKRRKTGQAKPRLSRRVDG